MEERAKQVAEMLKLLANENRLLILCALIQGKMNVKEIAEFVPSITQSALSQHLNLLKTSGILDSEKKGMHVVYSVADTRITELFSVLKKYYCN